MKGSKDAPPWTADTVFFDAAGTLFQVRGSVGEIYGRYAARFGFPGGGSEEVWKKIEGNFRKAFQRKRPMTFPDEPRARVGNLERQWWKDLVRRTFEPLGPFPRMEEFCDVLYGVFQTAGAWRLEEGCRDLLAQLQNRGKKLGVLSNFDSRIGYLLEDLGIDEYFHCVVVSSLAPAAKPSPRIFSYALKRIGARPEHTLHVGDDPEHDFQAARAAGLRALLYDPRDRFREQAGPCRVRSLAEVSGFLL